MKSKAAAGGRTSKTSVKKRQQQRFLVCKVFAVASTSASTAGLKRHKRVRLGIGAKSSSSHGRGKTLPSSYKRPHPIVPKATKKSSKTTAARTKPSLSPKPVPASAEGTKSQVYVLELEGGYVYVGKTSRGVQARLREHMGGGEGGGGAGGGCPAAAFTKLHRPTGRMLPRLGNLEGEGDGPERDETLRQMYVRGPQMVRGWKYVRAGMLRKPDLEEIEANIRELFDLCRTCGKAGHFATACKERKDRNGKALRASIRLS